MDDRDLDRYEQCQSPSHRRSRTDTGKFPRCWRAALLCLSGFLAAIGAAAPAAAAINYVQGNDNVADPGTSRSVTFTGAQSAGNLNVIIVSWFNATTTVTSIADTQGMRTRWRSGRRWRRARVRNRSITRRILSRRMSVRIPSPSC